MFNIKSEFEKNTELKQDDINYIKEWISKQPHLPKITDQQIVLFLHSCYYSLEASKITIDNYFTIRTFAPEIFSKRNPKAEDVQETLKTMYVTKLPGKTPEGYDVIFSKLIRTDPKFYIMADIVKTYNMQGDICSKDNGTSAGQIIVFDMDGISLAHVPRINMTVMKKNLAYLQDGIPVRLKGIHMLNVVPFIDMIMNLLKPFMNPELQSLFYYHQSNSEDVYKYIPKSMMPKDNGGDGASLSDLQTETIQLLESNAEWFKNEEQQRVDESKRQGKSKLSDDVLSGVSGSFKKLGFD